ncbi:MAG: aspartate aminotransferase family protein, partial [Gemmatimonadota bacterium]
MTASPSAIAPGDLSPAEFERHAAALAGWIASYLRDGERHPVLAQVTPGAVRATLPGAAPREAEPMDAILADLDRVVMPAVT